MRHRLLAENRLTRYMLYALGEILLVVAGILIALMINSAWQDRQDRHYEKEVLEQLRTSLLGDMDYFEQISLRADQRNAAINQLIEASHAGLSDPDSALLARYWDVINLGYSFSYNASIYESLKLRGVEKIRTDSLRLRILHTYENTLPRLVRFVNEYDEGYEIDLTTAALQASLFESVTDYKEDGSPYIRMIPVEGFMQKKELIEILRLFQMELEHFYLREQQLNSNLQITLTMIDDELKRIK